MVIEAAATMVTHHEPLAASDIDRVRLASHRVHSAREVLT
jgi:hypothetical protein